MLTAESILLAALTEIEEETRQLEEGLVADLKEEDDATELDGALGDVDNNVEQLTSSSSSNLENIR